MERNHATDSAVSWVLRMGAAGSFALIVLGLLLAVLLPGTAAQTVTTAGILLLLATPVLRIVVSLFAFAREKEWKYVLISLGVLGIVVGASLLGAALH